MSIETSAIASFLSRLYADRATGELIVTSTDSAAQSWKLYFYAGCLVYASGGKHPIRRWYRALRQQGIPQLGNTCPLPDHPDQKAWELEQLHQAIETAQITAKQAKAIVHSIIQEVLFALLDEPALTTQWNAEQVVNQRLAFISVEQMLNEVAEIQQGWRALQLDQVQPPTAQISPDLSPVLRSAQCLRAQVSPAIFKNLTRFMQGNHTLWDLAAHMQRSMPAIIRALLPLMRSGIIGLQEVSDLTAANSAFDLNAFVSIANPHQRGLIACVDDSPVVGQLLAQILTPLGYEVLPILDPLQGITTLLDRKPDLIFLDLLMPNTNGYEVCSFLRKTSVFQHTPIVILTDSDGMSDRVRAKLVGATEFFNKPIEKAKIVQVVQQYLNQKAEAKPAHRSDAAPLQTAHVALV